MDLGIAYCQYKLQLLESLKIEIMDEPSPQKRLQKYCDAFLICAEKKEMCGIHAMFSDSGLFPEKLQHQIEKLVQRELQIIEDIFIDANLSDISKTPPIAPKELAIIVNSTVKGALMLNRISAMNCYSTTISALLQMLV